MKATCLTANVEEYPALLDTEVALDNCTNVSVFKNHKLLQNIRRSDDRCTIAGHKQGAELPINLCGEFRKTTVMFFIHAGANVLCQDDVVNNYKCYEIPS